MPWQEGGKEMMACLLEARDDPSCPYYQRIDQIITLHVCHLHALLGRFHYSSISRLP